MPTLDLLIELDLLKLRELIIKKKWKYGFCPKRGAGSNPKSKLFGLSFGGIEIIGSQSIDIYFCIKTNDELPKVFDFNFLDPIWVGGNKKQSKKSP